MQCNLRNGRGVSQTSKRIFVEPDGDPEDFDYTCYIKLNQAIIEEYVGKTNNLKHIFQSHSYSSVKFRLFLLNQLQYWSFCLRRTHSWPRV